MTIIIIKGLLLIVTECKERYIFGKNVPILRIIESRGIYSIALGELCWVTLYITWYNCVMLLFQLLLLSPLNKYNRIYTE